MNGLTIKNAEIYLGDKPFYAIGLNDFHAFIGLTYKQLPDTGHDYYHIYEKDIASAKKLGIPFMRIPLGTWGEHGYYDWLQDKESYFALMDKVIAKAEECEIGIVASLFWRVVTMSIVAGEPASAMGDENSKTVALSKQYIHDIMTRYQNSPAIWAWEIGNEYNLDADWAPKHFGDHPEWSFTTDDFANYYKVIGEEIRKYDTYRPITSGNGEQRPFAYHMMKSYSKSPDWQLNTTCDTTAQFEEMMRLQNMDPINMVCCHFQHGNKDNLQCGYTEHDGDPAPMISVEDYLRIQKETAKKQGKAFYFGECGDMMQWHELGQHYLNNIELLHNNFYVIMRSIEKSGVQLSSAWIEGTVSGYTDNVINGNGEEHKFGYFKLLEFERMNRRYREAGLQDTADYWKNAKKIF